MQISAIINFLETLAPTALQESYDNAGLLAGSSSWECKGVLISLDMTEEVVMEAVERKCNLVVSHHPIIFQGLKKITGSNYVEKAVIAAIKNDIALYAIHTNLDNVIKGVNGKIASLLNLQNCKPLTFRNNSLKKLFTFAPTTHADKVRDAIFEAGGGHIGNYSECSFNGEGKGTFKAEDGTNPFVGEKGKRHYEDEVRIEVVFPFWLESAILKSMIAAHPYEEVAYDIIGLDNPITSIGSGLIGELEAAVKEVNFLALLQSVFGLSVIRHTRLLGRDLKRVAVCGGAGSLLISKAIQSGADVFITADVKYHEFFNANDKLVLIDIGHYESERFTIDLLHEVLTGKFLNFAVLKTGLKTNPVNYYSS